MDRSRLIKTALVGVASLDRSRLIKTALVGVAVLGVAVPRFRRGLGISRVAAGSIAAVPPVAIAIAFPRTKTRDFILCALQMHWYLTVFKMPNDDPISLEKRVKVQYPIRADRLLGMGNLPTNVLQKLAKPDHVRPIDKFLIWTHWLWFLVPHASVLYVLARHNDRFPRTATMVYAVFNLGAVGYWTVPTAPPWYAAEHGASDGRIPKVRRMMLEYGDQFWGKYWERMYDSFGANPLAAMPSMHFGTSVMAAHMLWEADKVAGSIGFAYAGVLGFALVYLGEHYVIDLVAGFLLTESVRTFGPKTQPLVDLFVDWIGQSRQSLTTRGETRCMKRKTESRLPLATIPSTKTLRN